MGKQKAKEKNPDTMIKLGMSDWPGIKVRVRYPEDSEIEKWPTTAMGLSPRAENAALRCGLLTAGQVMDHWDHLAELKPARLDPTRDGKGQGVGMATAVEIRRAVLRLLCEDPGVKVSLGMNLGGLRYEVG